MFGKSDFMKESIRSIELFCGTGGLALGLQSSGFKHTALYEWDKPSCDNIRWNIHNGYPSIKEWSVFRLTYAWFHMMVYLEK